MSGNLAGFDANKFEPNRAFEPIPTDWYKAVIVESELKKTKAGDGKFLELTIEVVDGPHKGRKVWDRLNLENPNRQAVDIARSTLSAICHAIGRMTPSDSAELHNIPMETRVTVTKRKDNGEMSNEVKGYRATKGGAAVAGAPAQQERQGADTGGEEPPPW